MESESLMWLLKAKIVIQVETVGKQKHYFAFFSQITIGDIRDWKLQIQSYVFVIRNKMP